MIEVREATGNDAESISRVFFACYGKDYAYPQFYDSELLRKMIYTDDTLVLVAEEKDTGEILGTASVIYNIGASSDLTGEFGRLAVLPEAREKGVGKLLMKERLARVADRLQVGLIDGRVVHPFTLKIAESQDFSVVGFVPLKMLISYRESIATLVRYFGDALQLRNNHPRIIPEVYPLACLAMRNCGLEPDPIVDEETAAYPLNTHYDLEEMTTEGYSSLLRIERGRVRNREIFGPIRLHYGFFKLKARKSQYLLAREGGQIVGAVGFTVDEIERAARIFELIALHDDVVRFLLSTTERFCREELAVDIIEVDVSAYAPGMQRTFLELEFLPVAYIPALVFHEVERLDAVKMVRLLVPLDLGPICLTDSAQKIADIVLKGFQSRKVAPDLARAVGNIAVFKTLSKEQTRRLAGMCTVEKFDRGSSLFQEGDIADRMLIIIEGQTSVHAKGSQKPVGRVGPGECLGEVALLTGAYHSAGAIAESDLLAAVLTSENLTALVRRRPDIGLLLYKNLACGLAEKLKRSDQEILSRRLDGE